MRVGDVIIRGSRRTYGFLTLVLTAILIYLELYPFAFRVPADPGGAVRTLIESWADRPSKGDFLANIVAYAPLGFCASLAIGRTGSRWGRFPSVVMFGAALSISFELTQYFVEGRVTSATDVYANTIGTTLGSAAAIVWHGYSSFFFRLDVFDKPVAVFLIVDWAAYRLYPYVPATDIHKFWEAIKPLVISPSIKAYDVWRHTVIWLTLFMLVGALVKGRRLISLLLPMVSVVFLTAARIAIVDKMLSTAEVAGAAIALCIWPVLAMLRARVCAYLIGAMLGSYIVAERLQPFVFEDTGREFGWIPFRSFLNGSPEINVMALFEKSFLYGGLLYLLGEAGWRLRDSTIFAASVLFITSWAETYLLGRSAEITDAILVALIAVGFSLVQKHTRHPQPDLP
jgi:glycopeptide antibiotics resistance protein